MASLALGDGPLIMPHGPLRRSPTLKQANFTPFLPGCRTRQTLAKARVKMNKFQHAFSTMFHTTQSDRALLAVISVKTISATNLSELKLTHNLYATLCFGYTFHILVSFMSTMEVRQSFTTMGSETFFFSLRKHLYAMLQA